MSTLIESKGLEEVRVLPPTQPLNETLWKAWVQKGRANERRGRAANVRIVTLGLDCGTDWRRGSVEPPYANV